MQHWLKKPPDFKEGIDGRKCNDIYSDGTYVRMYKLFTSVNFNMIMVSFIK
jgi:hypothetical protein